METDRPTTGLWWSWGGQRSHCYLPLEVATHCNAGPGPRKGSGLLRGCLPPQAPEEGRGTNRERHFTLRRRDESHVAAFPRRNQGRQGWARLGGIASLRIRGRKRERNRARN